MAAPIVYFVDRLVATGLSSVVVRYNFRASSPVEPALPAVLNAVKLLIAVHEAAIREGPVGSDGTGCLIERCSFDM